MLSSYQVTGKLGLVVRDKLGHSRYSYRCLNGMGVLGRQRRKRERINMIKNEPYHNPLTDRRKMSLEDAKNQEAFNRTLLILQYKGELGQRVFELGKLLYAVKQDFQTLNSDEAERRYGFGTFNAYLAAPEESGGVDFSRQTAYQFIRLYEKYDVQLNVRHALHDIDYTKLDKIIGCINKENVDEWLAKAKSLSRADLVEEIREYRQQQKQILFEENPLPIGKGYRTIVIDPPWEAIKMVREVSPTQHDWDYPSLSVDEIKALPINELLHPEGSHVYLWTTHKYLPSCFDILQSWRVKYECLLTWNKNV
jgi:MT-A70 protein